MSKTSLSAPGSRLALALVLGLCLVALPLVETSRRQGLELDAALAARRALEPLGRVADAQRALLAHQPRAAAVLAGRHEEEDERLRLQQRVDAEMVGLAASLEAQQLDRALDETDQLHAGWRALSLAVRQRQMEPGASDAAHALLVEQTYVIADLVAARTVLQGRLGPAGTPGAFADASEAALVLQALPRFEAALSRASASAAEVGRGAAAAATEPPGAGAAGSPPLRKQARRIARAAADVLAAADAVAAAGSAPPPAPSDVRTLIALRQAATRLAEPSAPTSSEVAREVDLRLRSAQAASAEARQMLQARLAAGAERAVEALRFERALVGAALGLLLLLGASAAWRAVPRTEACDDVASRDEHGALLGTPSPPAESEGPADELLRRLRERTTDFAPTTTSSRPETPH